MRRQQQHGLTLIELIISISILGVALTGTLAATGAYLSQSTTPAIRSQALAIAEAYLEEITLQAYSDPDGADNGGCEEANRPLYDDITDYACVNDQGGARDRNGNLIAGLDTFNVAVTISSSTLNGAPARRIDVRVGHDALGSQQVQLQAWRVPLP